MPTYESEHNRKAQLLVAKRLLELKGRGWRFVMSEREEKKCWDAKLWSPAERRWYEIKVRHQPWDAPNIQRDGFLIREPKIIGLLRVSAPGDPWGIVADCTDGLYGMTTRRRRVPTDWVLRKSGRRDRGDPRDLELCYFIPARYFRRLGETVNHARSGDLL